MGLVLEGIFVAVRSANALVVADDAEFTAQRVEIAELALRNRLPSVSGLRELAEAGGLMAYGASFGDLYRRAASHVSKILQGAKASDLPIEQPVKFEFVMNMRTAKLLGLSIPPSLLALADDHRVRRVTSGLGTFETCRQALKLSVHGGRPEVIGARPKRCF